MKGLKKILAVCLSAAIASLGMTAFADGETVQNIADGNIVLENASAENIVITGASKANTVSVKSGTYNITLQNVSIDVSSVANTPAFVIDKDAVVNLTLVGDNTLKSGSNCAGLQLNAADDQKGAVVIDGEGSLSATGGSKGAGIGGKSMSKNGSVTVNGGVVTANGTDGGAGIGGGNNGSSYKTTDGGVISIMGGIVTAHGNGGAAGIGGGNHGDGGVITIGGNAVIADAMGEAGGAGIGSGIGSSKGADKGPGYVNGGTITIEGDCVIKHASNAWCGAGIGGGMYSDSGVITINGGIIEAAEGGAGTAGSKHHGGAGIGAGYQGHSDITINGGTIKAAIGSFSGAGIGSGPVANTDKRPNPSLDKNTSVTINGGTIELAQGGEYGGAGIGAGYATDNCTVNIAGGKINAVGAESTEDIKSGGAGIGSGAYTVTGAKYPHTTNIDVNISGGTVYAEGGWGASAVGSGSKNATASNVAISGKASVTAVADGTKFAIDTDKGSVARTDFSQPVLQGTYTLPYRGLKTSVVKDGKEVRTVSLPDGYRSFAVDVDEAGTYMVKADGKTFAMKSSDNTDTDEQSDDNVYTFAVENTVLSDNGYLYPVSDDIVAEDKPVVVPVEAHDPYVLSNDFAYIFGRDNTKMEPNSDILRGEACAVIYRLLKQNNKLGGFKYDENAAPVFEGTAGRWDRSAAEYAAYIGVYPTDQILSLDSAIKRKEAFKLFALELGFTTQTNLTYEQYAQILVDKNYIEGYDDGTLGLDNDISRVEFCKVYNQIIGRDDAKLETPDGTQVTGETYGFTDVNDFWGTGVILRATSAYDADGYVDVEKRALRNNLDDYNN